MRTITVIVFCVMFIGPAAAQSSGTTTNGSAATRSEPATTGMGVRRGEAPIGHRQPTPSDLPPSARQGAEGGARDPFGPLPNICRGC